MDILWSACAQVPDVVSRASDFTAGALLTCVRWGRRPIDASGILILNANPYLVEVKPFLLRTLLLRL